MSSLLDSRRRPKNFRQLPEKRVERRPDKRADKRPEKIEPKRFTVKSWLTQINCPQYIPLFIEHSIESYDLVSQLDSYSLRELGVRKVGDIIRISRSLNQMKVQKLANRPGSKATQKLSDQFIETVVKFQIKANRNRRRKKSKNKRVDNDGYFSEGEAHVKNVNQTGRGSSSTAISSSSGSSENDHIERMLSSLAPVSETDKHIAGFILQTGQIKRINTAGCFTAEAIKKKVLKKLGLKSSQFDRYNTYFIDTNDNIHLMFDVELVSLVRSPDRIERNRIIFCKSSEDPTSESLDMSRRITERFEAPKARRTDTSSRDKYVNVNTSSGSSRRTAKKSSGHSRKNRDMKPLYEQRPPSELISTNLAEYFPETPSKELHRTIKNSVRYSVRMSRAFSRMSMMSTSSNFARNSIITLQNSPRTVGDVWMNNASELDEAVLGDDKDFMDIVGGYKRPKSRFIPNGAPPLPDIESPDLDNAKRRHRKDKSRSSNKRLSVAITSGKDSGSKIELLDLDHIDNEPYPMQDTGEDPEEIMKNLESHSGFDRNTGPEHWLKGKRIGAGSFGIVYLGLNSFTGELMAVKQVEIPKVKELNVGQSKASSGSSTAVSSSSDDASTLKGDSVDSDRTIGNKGVKDHKQNMIDALQREMALLKELKHEKIVRYLGSSSDDSFLNIFLEYVPGGSITSMLNNYGPFKEPLIRNFTSQILIGLKYLHSKNIIHRDIKGGNILIDNNGGAKISDFGISKKIETSMQAKRASLQGSVYWMAPEVVRQITNSEKSDIWSVGCLIIEMFTGKHPFPEFSQMQAIFRIGTHSTPDIPENCTEECKDFLGKTFIIEYKDRPSAKELLGHTFLNSLIMSER